MASDKDLRNEWDSGFVVSDYNAIDELVTRHYVAKDKAEQLRKLSRPEWLELDYIDCYATLPDQIRQGK